MSIGGAPLSTHHLLTVVAFLVNLHSIYGAQIAFTERPKSVILSEGSTCQFNCSAVTANPRLKPNYFWKFNGDFIADDNVNGFMPQGRLLVIKNVSEALHQGKYQCVAFQEDFGAIISLPAFLQITYLNVSKNYQSNYSVLESVSILIKAPLITGRPQPSFVWHFRDKSGHFAEVSHNDTITTKYGHLLFPNISKKYSSVFRLFVIHPSVVDIRKFVAEINVRVRGKPVTCLDDTIVFPIKEVNRKINEGQDLLLECLGVANRCSLQRDANWQFQLYGRMQTFPSKLIVKNVKLADGGTYSCHVSVGNKTNRYAVIIGVKAKPVFQLAIPNDIDIQTTIPVSPGLASFSERVEWYTNGERITGSTNMVKQNADNKLKIVHLSKSLSGIYQIYHINGDLVTSQEVNVFVTAGTDFGEKISGTSGSIVFNPSSTPSSGVTYSSWLIQVPAIKTVYVTIASPPKCASDGTTQLHLYQGSTADGRSVKSLCRNGGYKVVVDELKGPFITLVLVTRNLTNSAFAAYYDVHRPTTTLPTTTTTTSTTQSSTGQFTPSKDMTSSSPKTSTRLQTTMAPGGKKDQAAGTQIGAIIGAIAGAACLIIIVIIALFCYRQWQERRKPPDQTPQFPNTGKRGMHPSMMPRNTYLMRRPGNDQKLPCFTVQQPGTSSMPDVIPEYDAVTERLELGYLGEDTDNNQTYEKVEDVVERAGLGSQGIGNLAYEPTKLPKAVIGRRIPSGPGGKHFIRTDITQIPRDPELQLQQQQLKDGTYNSVDEGSDYLEPVECRSRLVSMEGRPLPSPVESCPVYHTLERDATPPRGSDVYEMPFDSTDNKTQEKLPATEKAESSYAALEEKPLQKNENTYEPLALERERKKPGSEKHDKKDNVKRDVAMQPIIEKDNESAGGDYCHPCEPGASKSSASDTPSEYQPLNEHLSPIQNNNHKKLEAQGSGFYETLNEAENDMGDYQALTLPR